jgi:hypothetical protein
MRHTNKGKANRRLIRPSIRGVIPSFLISLIAAGGIYYLRGQSSFRESAAPIQIGSFETSLPLLMTALMFLFLMARPVVLLFDSYYTIGRHHLYAVIGRISINRRLTEVPFEDMRGVRCDQTIIQRLLNIGSVVVWTATVDAPAITMRWVRNPEAVTNELCHRIDRARQERPSAAPGQDLEIQHRAAVVGSHHSSAHIGV